MRMLALHMHCDVCVCYDTIRKHVARATATAVNGISQTNTWFLLNTTIFFE